MMASSTIDEEQLVKDMLYRIRQVNRMSDDVRSSLIDFQVDGLKLGKVSAPETIVNPTLCYLSNNNGTRSILLKGST
jgi:hypothetical protein